MGIPEFNRDEEFMGGRGQMVAFNHQKLCEHGYYKGQQSQSNNQNSLTHRDHHWLARIEIGRQLKPDLVGIIRKALNLVIRKSDLYYHNKESQISRTGAFYKPEGPRMRGRLDPFEEDPSTLPTIYSVYLPLQSSPMGL